MEPVDTAFEKFKSIVENDILDYEDTIVSEADVRLKIIDRIFVEVLGWPYRDIQLESQAGPGFIDYRCTINQLNRLVIEAKKQGRDFGINKDKSGRYFKLNGSVFNSKDAKEGIEQAIRYCGHKNAELACVTNGYQWIIFLGNRRGNGKDTMEGQALVYGSLNCVVKHFKKFYDLLGYDSVAGYRYRAEFQDAEGQPLRTSIFNAPLKTPESRILIPSDKLYADIDRIMVSFFRDLKGDDDAEMRKKCFVTTDESNRAEASIARISEDLRDRVKTLKTDGKGETNEITKAIARVKEMKRQEFVLLVGTKGAGKSSFMDRFFEDVLPEKISSDCVLVRIDFANCGADEHSIVKWLDEHFLEATEKAVFGSRQPDFDDLKGMYYSEYTRMSCGSLKPLYESDRIKFDIKFGEHVEKRREERPYEHIVHMLHRIVFSDKKVPCLIFDNADHFNIDFQERVFQYAHSIFKEVLCLVMFPITDKTSWQLSRQGALQSFFTESFYLPSPLPSIVLRKRLEYIESKIKEDEKPERGKGYFFGRGIEFSIENLKKFTSTVQNVFINSGQVSEWIGNLANNDIRRCLQLTRDIVGSPYIKVHEILKSVMTKSTFETDLNNVMFAMTKGKYDLYQTGQNAFVHNLFAITTEYGTSPLLGMRILHQLEATHYQQAEGESRYVIVNNVIDYFNAMNIEAQAIRGWLSNMLKSGLLLSYDPTQSFIEEVYRIEISPSGYQHLLWARSNLAYIESMLEVTPLCDRSLYQELQHLMNLDLPFARRKAIKLFYQYLVKEDNHYCIIPNHAQYDGQRDINEKLKQCCDELSGPYSTSSSSRYGRPYGKVISWFEDRGYGFIQPEDGGANVFLHIRKIINSDLSSIPIGTTLEYDIEHSEKGLCAIKAAVL